MRAELAYTETLLAIALLEAAERLDFQCAF
jgi:hypothetical protein